MLGPSLGIQIGQKTDVFRAILAFFLHITCLEHNNSHENEHGKIYPLTNRRHYIHISEDIVFIALRVLDADDDTDTNGAADPNKKEASLDNHRHVLDTHVGVKNLRDFVKGKDGQKVQRCYANTLK